MGNDGGIRTDVREKSTGRAIYTQDIQFAGMLTAVVAHAPRFGSKVKSFDRDAAQAKPGVKFVVGVSSGVAVLARDFWTAKSARDTMDVVWDDFERR